MWNHDATEVAYKNGFEDGLMKSKEEIDRLKHTIRVLEIALSNASEGDFHNSQNPLYCPFCKKEVSVEKEARYFFDSYYVFCGNVECPVMPKSMYFRTREEAIDAWTGNRNFEKDRP